MPFQGPGKANGWPRLVADTDGTVAGKRDEAGAAGNQSEVILVVEDDEDVRAA
jgi:hypothetical protein